jgi:UPF0755 protein
MKKIKAKYYLAPAILCMVGVIAFAYYFTLTNFSAKSETQYLYVDSDDTVDSIIAKLTPMASQHAITGLRTMIRHSNYENNPRTGRFAIEPGRNIFSTFRMLKNGQQSPIMLTLPESKTMEQLAAQLSKKLMIDSTAIVTALTNQESVKALGYDTCTIACMMVPNTYEVYWNISIDALLKRLKKEHDAFWNYDRQHRAEVIGLSPNEVCTLASIIDEETSNNAEKPMIAGMYLNRLAQDMPLQADPTVKFALKNFGLRRIYHDMLRIDSPYNTYANTGLPPGPIKIASIKGIDAVLNRVQHDFLYMCAKEDFSGTHNFARTYSEHLQNAARYAAALNQRGIK